MIDQFKKVPLPWQVIIFVAFLLIALCMCGLAGTMVYYLFPASVTVSSPQVSEISTPLVPTVEAAADSSQVTLPAPTETQAKQVSEISTPSVLTVEATIDSPQVTQPTSTEAPPKQEQSQIVFVKTDSRVGGEYDLYLMNPDGSNMRQLTALPGLETSPAWSRDGQMIAFLATQDSTQPNDCVTGYVELKCNFEIYTIGRDGANLKRITTLPSYERGPTWSPDGQAIAFSSREAGASFGYIYVIKVDGTDLTTLTKGEVRDTSPSWSPDGKKIAFTREACCEAGTSVVDIYIMNTDGTEVTRLTNGEQLNANPAWSPDGQSLAWMRLEDNSEDAIGQIAVMKPDGTEQTVIKLDISVSIGYPPAWSPDSQRFMFVHQEGNSLDLYQVNRDGTNLTKITDSTAFYSAPAWSPAINQ